MESRWEEIQSALGEMLELSTEEYQTYLERSGLAPGIRFRVEELLRAWRESEGFLERGPVAPAVPETDRWIGQRLGPWRVVSVIGEGGMGAVYLAVRDDREFTQQAVLKVIAAGRLSRSTERRFREERQILARLEHPQVARLIDGGVAADGYPYLVMEYVEGTPIDAWSREQGLDRRGKLRLFREVCEAVQFAHQNLVVHCDLKPANILVTRDGSPKLLDFGIARLLQEEREVTGTLIHPLTPDYASPEQVRGETPGTASDVYSLGILLHELLTGRRPYRVAGKPLSEVLATVCEKEIDPPRTGAGDLEAILLKALAKEPHRRYGSAEKLAGDIGCYLEGRPVSARPDTYWYRFRRLVARRAFPLGAACAVAAAILAGTLATLAQSRRAERRFNDVRTLAHSFLYEVYDSVSALPGSLEARRLLAGRAQEYLDSLAREAAGDTDLARELAESYVRLADVRGVPYGANLGDTAGAVESYRKAQALLETPAARHPGDAALQKALGRVYGSIANILVRQKDARGAEAAARQAIATSEALSARFPEEMEYRLDVGRATVFLGEALSLAAHQSGSLALYEQALAMYERALEIQEATGPRDQESWLMRLGPKYFYTGYALRDLGEYTGDLSYYRRALDLSVKGEAVYRKIEALHPDRPDRNVFDGLADIGFLRWKCCGDLAGAMRDFREAAAGFESIAGAEVQNTEARRDVADVYQKIGLVLAEAGHRVQATAADRKALAIYEDLARVDPASGENAGYLAAVRARLADLELGK